MKKKRKAPLIAEILLLRSLPLEVIKEITDLCEEELLSLQKKISLDEVK
ncbi:MAG: hypothetical protein ACI4XL_11430 [Bacillus sp. (in: firmicutes)]